MPPKVVKRGDAARKTRVSSKAAIQNQQQEPEPDPVKNPIAGVVVEENTVDTNNLAPETLPNGLVVVESKSPFLSIF